MLYYQQKAKIDDSEEVRRKLNYTARTNVLACVLPRDPKHSPFSPTATVFCVSEKTQYTSTCFGSNSSHVLPKSRVVYQPLYNNQINARALIGQSAVGYCAGKPTEKSRVF